MTPILIIPTGRGVTRSLAPSASTGGGAYVFGTAATFVSDGGGGGGGGFPSSSEDRAGWKTFEDHQRDLRDKARRDAERAEEARRKVPEKAQQAVRRFVRGRFKELAGLDEMRRAELLRAQMLAEQIRFRRQYEDFLRAEMERFAEEEAIFMLLTIAASVQ